MSRKELSDSLFDAGAYDRFLTRITGLLEAARHAAARSVNAVMTATYWEIGRRIVEYEQGGERRAEYGKALLKRVSADLTSRFGRGFSERNLEQMRRFYLDRSISQTVSAESGKVEIDILSLARHFPLPWSHYVKLMAVASPEARAFYEEEALSGGWTVRQLDRQISTQFYERAALSRDRAAMLKKGSRSLPEDRVTPEEALKGPLVPEFLGLKDEYSESGLEEALIRHLESFLLELGGDFAFVGRQRRLRVGLILCARKDEAVAHYALEGLSDAILAAEYRTALPDEKVLAAELAKTRHLLERRPPSRSSEDKKT